MHIRIDTPTYQAGLTATRSRQAAAMEGFAAVLQNAQKQKNITEEQVDYFHAQAIRIQNGFAASERRI